MDCIDKLVLRPCRVETATQRGHTRSGSGGKSVQWNFAAMQCGVATWTSMQPTGNPSANITAGCNPFNVGGRAVGEWISVCREVMRVMMQGPR